MQFQAANMHDPGFRQLFDHLDEVGFFIKDEAYRIVHANRAFYRRLGFETLDALIGKDDFELFPRPLAEAFRRDDEDVLNKGVDMPDLVELFLNPHGLPAWFVTHKFPVRNPDGTPIGVMGVVQPLDQQRGLNVRDAAVAQAVKQMLQNPGHIESLAELAASLKLSHRHFDRRFKVATGMTPGQFLVRCRIQNACLRLQDPEARIADLALDLGYCDQSAFTAQFRTRMGVTPAKYQRRFGHDV